MNFSVLGHRRAFSQGSLSSAEDVQFLQESKEAMCARITNVSVDVILEGCCFVCAVESAKKVVKKAEEATLTDVDKLNPSLLSDSTRAFLNTTPRCEYTTCAVGGISKVQAKALRELLNAKDSSDTILPPSYFTSESKEYDEEKLMLWNYLSSKSDDS